MRNRFKIQRARDNTIFWERRSGNRRGWLRGFADKSLARLDARRQVGDLVHGGARHVLEVGPGACVEREKLDRLFREYGVRYTGVDIAQGFVDRGKKLFPDDDWKVCDISEDPPMEADVIYSQHVIEHCPALAPALGWMLKTAKVAVVYIFFVPPGDIQKIRRRHRGWLFQNEWKRKEVIDLCLEHGFVPHLTDYDNRNGWFRGCYEKDETLLVATKKEVL